ncbi:hypothetical protein [Mesorhizobium sp. M3A.F.Ca.ET.201.01.1.1]|uniref:hypothetical protein n=1 Tax=Mesorhizobium sp. M3A.F.Ca.ET.201.01.1.1 TaxID=2563946 RepID=UPI001FEFF889|nr:hypothetical protein [Mesorhizobium sp. M3A.F.Ca.ET.201.01.1.1]
MSSDCWSNRAAGSHRTSFSAIWSAMSVTSFASTDPLGCFVIVSAHIWSSMSWYLSADGSFALCSPIDNAACPLDIAAGERFASHEAGGRVDGEKRLIGARLAAIEADARSRHRIAHQFGLGCVRLVLSYEG